MTFLDVRENLVFRNVSMYEKLKELFKMVEKLEDDWVYKQERNIWDSVCRFLQILFRSSNQKDQSSVHH